MNEDALIELVRSVINGSITVRADPQAGDVVIRIVVPAGPSDYLEYQLTLSRYEILQAYGTDGELRLRHLLEARLRNARREIGDDLLSHAEGRVGQNYNGRLVNIREILTPRPEPAYEDDYINALRYNMVRGRDNWVPEPNIPAAPPEPLKIPDLVPLLPPKRRSDLLKEDPFT